MLLSVVLFLPLVFAVLLAFWPQKSTLRHLALGLSLIEFLASLAVLNNFDQASAALQMAEQYSWVPRFGISYFIGVDGISLMLIMLTTFLIPVIILGSWNSISERVKGFHVALFVLQTAMMGSFLAMDAVLFYVFWELSLVPMYFIVGIWGGARRIYATIKFFIYTMAGSVLMLLAIIFLMRLTPEVTGGAVSASLLDFYKLQIPFVAGDFFTAQTLLFFAFALAFAIKVPLFPLHTWLPDAHVEAPTPGSVVLAGVMLKMGTFCYLRWVIPLFSEAAEYYAWFFASLGVIGIVYGALVAMVQPDVKKLVAYSSVSHMGYVILGIFVMNQYGVNGALYQMLNHGISTGALFLLIGMIYERTHSRMISKYGGLASALPVFTIMFVIVTMSSIAVPLTNGFVGEFLILMGTFQYSPIAAGISVTGVILGAAYMLWMVKRVFFGPKGEIVTHAEEDKSHALHDLSVREWAVMTPLIILIFWMGIFPNHFMDYSKKSVDHLISNKHNYTLEVK
ncbi:MAG: NADH-quinone oxidoreductase subunit M [Bdellovibrionota bacterium]